MTTRCFSGERTERYPAYTTKLVRRARQARQALVQHSSSRYHKLIKPVQVYKLQWRSSSSIYEAFIKHASIAHQASSMCAWCMLDECSSQLDEPASSCERNINYTDDCHTVCSALLHASQLMVGVDAMRCVRCDSWENQRLRRSGHTCEHKPPRPVTCSSPSSDKCMIATDYAADG